VFDDPVPELYVVLVDHQPEIVELSVHARPVPLEASVSKSSVSGTPVAVMLPPLVIANDGGLMPDEPTRTQIRATAIAEIAGRRTDRGCEERDMDMARRECSEPRRRDQYKCV